MKKLTLSADDKVIKQAKRFAAENHTSVSAMFERFVQAVVRRRGPRKRLGAITRKATGVIALPESKSDRRMVEEALGEKYGL